MDLYNTLIHAAEKADREGLSLTALKLYEALSALNTEETKSTCVYKAYSDDVYYAKATDPIQALRLAHNDLCQCGDTTLIVTPNAIGLCTFFVNVKDAKRYI